MSRSCPLHVWRFTGLKPVRATRTDQGALPEPLCVCAEVRKNETVRRSFRARVVLAAALFSAGAPLVASGTEGGSDRPASGRSATSTTAASPYCALVSRTAWPGRTVEFRESLKDASGSSRMTRGRCQTSSPHRSRSRAKATPWMCRHQRRQQKPARLELARKQERRQRAGDHSRRAEWNGGHQRLVPGQRTRLGHSDIAHPTRCMRPMRPASSDCRTRGRPRSKAPRQTRSDGTRSTASRTGIATARCRRCQWSARIIHSSKIELATIR